MFYKLLLRFLFLMNPENAHHFVMHVLRFIIKIPNVKSILKSTFYIEKPVNFIGIRFSNIVGLAAGFDKNAEYLNELEALGFGFIEIGTVTPVAQNGNDKPRLFRLKKDEALINRMGFNNKGVDAVIENLKTRPENLIVGGNIGKNKITPNENAISDYEVCFTKLYDYVDYFVVNVSSPNTPGLRELQDKEPLMKILSSLMNIRHNFTLANKPTKPLLLKIAPDLTNEQLDDIIEIVNQTKIDGLVATNTTLSRENLHISKEEIETIGAGGLSGKILADRSTEVISYINNQSKGTIAMMGVGGIHDTETAQQKINAGATLIQFYTAFIYEGPWLIKKLVKTLHTH
jgi:dihydroorotate dehydrogenase